MFVIATFGAGETGGPMVSVLGSGLAGIGLWPGPLRFVLRQLYGYSASTCLGYSYRGSPG